MPDPVDPTPVKVVPKGGGFAVVSKQGRTIDTAPSRDRADALAARVNETWDEAKGERRSKGAPEVTEGIWSAARHMRGRGGRFRLMQQIADMGRVGLGPEYPTKEYRAHAEELIRSGHVSTRWDTGIEAEMLHLTDRGKRELEARKGSRLEHALGEIEEYAGMGVGPGLRTLPKGPKGPSLLSRFEERLHPRQHGKFTFSPLGHADRGARHAALERHVASLGHGEHVELEKAKGHDWTPAVTVKRTRSGKYLVEGGGQAYKSVNAQALREHDSPRKAARDAIKAWEDAPRRHEGGEAMAARTARNRRLRGALDEVEESAAAALVVYRQAQREARAGGRANRSTPSPAWREAKHPRQHGKFSHALGHLADDLHLRGRHEVGLREAEELEERLLPHGSPRGSFGRIGHVLWDPAKHPRGRGGEFSRVLATLAHGGRANLPSGVAVHRHGKNAYEVEVPGEKDRVAGTLPGTATAAHHGGNPELLTRKAAVTRALIAHHEVALGERGTIMHKLASNRLVLAERERVAKELRGLYKAREGVRGFVGRLSAFGHELATDEDVPAWARWGMRLAVTVAVVPIVPGDELLGPLIVGALMVRPSTRKHVKELWDEARYGLPPGVDIPTSEKVERALKRSWARAEGLLDRKAEEADLEEYAGMGVGPGLRTLPKGPKGPGLLSRFEERLHPRQHGKFAAKHLAAANVGGSLRAELAKLPDLDAEVPAVPLRQRVRNVRRGFAQLDMAEPTRAESVLADIEELAIPQATPRGAGRKATPAGRTGGRGTSGAAVAAQSAQVAKAAAVRANAGAKAKSSGGQGGGTTTATTTSSNEEQEKPRQKQAQKETD